MEENFIRVEVKNLYKKFNIGFAKNENALARIFTFLSRIDSKKEIQVLKDISFEVRAKENLGIIGHNGSGKSTLLRIIADIYSPNQGSVKSHGRMIYLTGFGHGLNNRLTMRENIFLMGSILGLGQKDIRNKFDEIVDFSGLKEFVDTKVYKFSSGMLTRLTISVTLFCVAHAKPEILLIDEAFAGGVDINFQEKSVKKMEELLKSGAAVIFVSHDLNSVKKYCDRVIWLDHGEIRLEGDPIKVVQEYISFETNR